MRPSAASTRWHGTITGTGVTQPLPLTSNFDADVLSYPFDPYTFGVFSTGPIRQIYSRDTIGAIYDCALDPQQWPDTCRRISDLCESTAGGICVHDMRHVQNDQLFVFG